MAKQITAGELATELGTDNRTVRKFLRNITPKDEQPGKGSRWSIPGNARDVAKLRKQFDEWTAKQAERQAAATETEEEAVAEEELELDD